MDLNTLVVVVVLSVTYMLLAFQAGRASAQKKPRPTRRIMTVTPTPKRQLTAGLNSTRDIVATLLVNYIRQDPPMKDRPTEVKIGIYVNSFYSVSEQTMDYSVNMYLRQKWRDPRLTFEAPNPKLEQIRLGDVKNSGYKDVWVPDIFFRNEKKAEFHTVTIDNKLMRLKSDGELWYVTKISATLSCPMKLHKYPFDTQVCPMMFESFGYTMDTLYFAWLDEPVQLDADVLFPQFALVDKLLYDCSLNYTAGAFPCQEIRFVLRRQIGFFVIQIFVPTILVVILSWVSFWINIDGVPARVSIGLLTVLTTTTQSSGINSQLPRVSYIKAIDIWMIMCLIFVFAALLEYAFVNVAARNGVRIRTPIVRHARPLHAGDGDRNNLQDHARDSVFSNCFKGLSSDRQRYTISVDAEGCKRRARQIDKVSRKSFPLAFLLFNVVYWMAYTIPTTGSDDDEPSQ